MNEKTYPRLVSPKPFSRQLAEHISALEGLYMSAEMKAKFSDFDTRGLTGHERRLQLLAHFKNT